MLASTLDLAEQPEGASAKTGIGISPKFLQGRLGFLALLVKGVPSQVPRRLVWALEGGYRSFEIGNFHLGGFVLVAFRSDHKETTAFQVTHVVPADAGVVPVGHDQ